VISPEGCAAILWKSGDKAPEAAEALKLTSHDLKAPGHRRRDPARTAGGAHRDLPGTIRTVKEKIAAWLAELAPIPVDRLLDLRFEKFRRMGSPVAAAS
jgi:acetyl-CoA carboxylase carboxyl transferase subunit alpha